MRDTNEVEIHAPASTDGYELNRLIASSPPLDPNSIYCNLLQCSHFQGTSVCAKAGGTLAGFISGYLIPDRPDTLFVWQVVVADDFRGQDLAGRMLQALIERPACKDVQFIETTITPSNQASAALFRKFAQRIGEEAQVSEGFDEQLHFGGQHESEQLWRIGPVAK